MLGFRVWGLGHIRFRGGFGNGRCLGFSVYMCGIWRILRFSLECSGFRGGEG